MKALSASKAIFKPAHGTDPVEEAAGLLAQAAVLAGNATPDEIRSAARSHAEHSDFFPKPAELLAIVRAHRPAVTDHERIAAGEATVRADNQRLAMADSKIRWHLPPNGKPEMFIPGGPGEMRACAPTGRVIAPMFKNGPNGAPGEWFVTRDDARILADAYSDTNAAYRIKGNTIVAVDANGDEWTHPNDD